MTKRMDWARNIRLRQLEILARLCEAESLSQVAEEFHITQPALSKWLREFEDHVGTPLFQRHARGVTPLPAALELARHTRDIASRLKRAQTSIEQLKTLATSQLIMGVSPMVAVAYLPRIIDRFRSQQPSTFLQIEEATVDTLIPRLRAGQIDLAVGRVEHDDVSHDLILEKLEDLTPCLAVCINHPLAGKKHVEWAETLKFPWIAPLAASPVRQQMKLVFERVGLDTLPIMIESSYVATTARLLPGTDLVAPLSQSLAPLLGITRTLNVAWPDMPIKAANVLLWRHDDHRFELLQQLLDIVRTEVGRYN